MNKPRRPAARNGRSSVRARNAPTAETSQPDAATASVPATAPIAWTPMASVPLAVRWGDLDAFNHVNNAAFMVYVQEARLVWLAAIEGPWFDETMMPVVAAATMNYRRQLSWPSSIVIELAPTRIGNSSVTIAHRVVADGDRDCVYADGEVVMVWIDPSSGRSVPLPPAIRTACGPGAGSE